MIDDFALFGIILVICLTFFIIGNLKKAWLFTLFSGIGIFLLGLFLLGGIQNVVGYTLEQNSSTLTIINYTTNSASANNPFIVPLSIFLLLIGMGTFLSSAIQLFAGKDVKSGMGSSEGEEADEED